MPSADGSRTGTNDHRPQSLATGPDLAGGTGFAGSTTSSPPGAACTGAPGTGRVAPSAATTRTATPVTSLRGTGPTRRGASVTAFDLSPGYVREAEERAAANGVSVRFVVADGEALPFPDESFDCVWGNAVLHHLDLAKAGAELKRVLTPGGVAVFCEPWGGNPLLEFARKHLPYPGKNRTADEQPLRPGDLGPLREMFPSLTIEGFQLLSMVRRVWNNPRITSALERLDARCLLAAPILTKWCRYVVLVMTKG